MLVTAREGPLHAHRGHECELLSGKDLTEDKFTFVSMV